MDKSSKNIKNFRFLAQNVLTFLVKYAIIKVENERGLLYKALLLLRVLTFLGRPVQL